MTSILKQDHMINNNNINNYGFETKQKQVKFSHVV